MTEASLLYRLKTEHNQLLSFFCTETATEAAIVTAKMGKEEVMTRKLFISTAGSGDSSVVRTADS